MCVVFMANYFLVGDDVTDDSETVLMIDFVNLNNKLTQFFKGVHRSKIYAHIFIEVSTHHI
jgi:hypothetical protein